MKRYADDSYAKDMNFVDKKKVIDLAHNDAMILMKFLLDKDIGPSRSINGISHLLGIMIASGEIDEEDVRNIYQLVTFSGKMYKEMLEDEENNASS